MKRAIFGAVLGENRLLRSYDTLGYVSWGWTPVIGSDVSCVREVIATFGNNIVALCELLNGNEAIYHSPDQGNTWTKALEVTDIYDITSVGYNWTLASTSDGWYSSLTSGYTWEATHKYTFTDPAFIAGGGGELSVPEYPWPDPAFIAGGGGESSPPLGKSVVWVSPNHLFAHDGYTIWLSEDRAESWERVCTLSDFDGFSPNHTKWNSIDGYYGRIIATCGEALVETLDLGETWTAVDLSTKVRGWSLISAEEPIWRQVVFWGTLGQTDSTKSRWMISAVMSKSNIIRTFVNRGTDILSPVVDMALSQRHRLNATVSRRAGQDLTEVVLMISGDRRVEGELRHAETVSSDGITFNDVLAGSTRTLAIGTTPKKDLAYASFSAMGR